MLKDTHIETAVTAQVVSAPKYNSLNSADCWVLMLNLACALAPQGSDDFNFKDGPLPPLISNLPARNMREAEMAVYLIEMGVPLKKVSRCIELLMFLQVHSFAPHDRILGAYCYPYITLPYHRHYFNDDDDCNFINVWDECRLLMYLLRALVRYDGKVFTFDPQFAPVDASPSYDELYDDLEYLDVDPMHITDLIDALIALHPVTSTGHQSHNVLLISPPSSLSASA